MEKDLLRIGSAYIRVSDERQDEYSPDSQLKKIREYAAKDGYMIPDEFVFYDDGISGKSTKKRNDFNRMIAIAKEKNHPFDRIYVWKFSRFARNQEESMVYKNLLRKKGVTVISVSEPIPEGHFGSLIERIIEWTDEYYLVNLGAEVTRGMTEKASRGEPTCAPPFGYIMRDKKYYPDEESGKANIVREVFTLFSNGVGQREIAIILGQRGVRTKYGNMPKNRWIEYMLRNPCYIGMIRWTPDGTRSVSKGKLDNENIMIVPGGHEPLISQDLWDKVQKMIDAQKKAYPKYARREQPVQYMLKGLVRCSSCGGTIAMSSAVSGKSKVRTLQCCNYSKGSCHTSHSITMPRLEAAFMEGIRQAVEGKQFTISPRVPKKQDQNIIDFDKLIAVEERRLKRAKEAYLAEIDTIEQYGQNKKEITARIDDLIARRDKEIVEKINMDEFTKKVAGIVEFIEREDVTDQAKNEALHTIIEKIVFEKAKGNLAIFFHDL
ncbi:MAG: recombinase family protein [Ruminococcaceae bacterium]|nr:recombinase family protein [Oscillospiraceae bacterium]